jgi:hypothetical protein
MQQQEHRQAGKSAGSQVLAASKIACALAAACGICKLHTVLCSRAVHNRLFKSIASKMAKKQTRQSRNTLIVPASLTSSALQSPKSH